MDSLNSKAGPKTLGDLFTLLFSAEDIRRFIATSSERGRSMSTRLPAGSASLAEVAHAAEVELEREGLIEKKLFVLLVTWRPYKAAEIGRVAVKYGIMLQIEQSDAQGSSNHFEPGISIQDELRQSDLFDRTISGDREAHQGGATSQAACHLVLISYAANAEDRALLKKIMAHSLGLRDALGISLLVCTRSQPADRLIMKEVQRHVKFILVLASEAYFQGECEGALLLPEFEREVLSKIPLRWLPLSVGKNVPQSLPEHLTAYSSRRLLGELSPVDFDAVMHHVWKLIACACAKDAGASHLRIPAHGLELDEVEDRIAVLIRTMEEMRAQGEPTEGILESIIALKRQKRRGPVLSAGDELEQGRYVLELKVGAGGYSTVWRAYDRQRKSVVALKVLLPEESKNATTRGRFIRGARVLAETEHGAIIKALEHARESAGFLYYPMEFADSNLAVAVSQGFLQNPSEKLAALKRIAIALHFLHRRNMVHRDIKPTNILFSSSNRMVYLADFDLIHARDTTGGTKTGAMGTILYAAPEVLSRPQDCDRRADIYSLGMTAIFLLLGSEPPLEIMFHEKRRERLSKIVRDTRLLGIIEKAIAVRSEDRYGDVKSFFLDLELAWPTESELLDANAPNVRGSQLLAAEKMTVDRQAWKNLSIPMLWTSALTILIVAAAWCNVR